jgi:hypothetical protein
MRSKKSSVLVAGLTSEYFLCDRRHDRASSQWVGVPQTANSVRSRATVVDFGGEKLWVADLYDIIRSKRAAGRPKDLAVLHELETTLKEKEKESDTRRDSSSPPEGT